jgi:hypothetical protein
MRCHRCHGSMVQEKFYGPGDAFWGWRCIACGEVMDEVILENRGSFGVSGLERHRRSGWRKMLGR